MNRFMDLPLNEQASLVLLCLLEDVATEKRTMASIEYHIHDLYKIISDHYNVPDQEVNLIVEAVAKRGVEMLPGYADGRTTEATAEAS